MPGAPWILYTVAMATFTVTDNRFSLDTFPKGAALLTNGAGAPQCSAEMEGDKASDVFVCTEFI